MEIAAITLKNFRKFQDRTFNFSKEVNVVMGENEAGKSTIMQAIIFALFVDVKTRSKKFYDYVTKWGASAPSVIEMEFNEDGENYKLIKNFTEGTAKLENLQTGKTLEDPSLVQEALARLNPIKSDTVYKATALIKQSDVAKIEKPTDLNQAIERSISTGANVSLEEVLKVLKKQQGELVRGLKSPAKNPGVIKALEDRLVEMRAQYEEFKKAWEERVGASEKERTSAGQLTEIEEKIVLIERMINNQKIFDEAEKELEEIDKQLRVVQDQLLRVENLEKEMVGVEEKLSGYKQFMTRDLEIDADTASKLDVQVNAKSKMIENLEYGASREEAQKKMLGVGVGETILFTLVIAFFILGFIVNTMLIGLAALIAMYASIQTSGKLRKQAKLSGQSQSLAQIAEMRKSLENDQKGVQKILAKYKVESVKELYSNKIKLATIREEKNRLEAEIKGVLGDKVLQDLKAAQVDILTKKREIEVTKLTDEVKASKLSPEKYLEKRRELDKLKVERRKLERENVQAEVVAEDEIINYEQLVKLEEEIENAQTKLQEAKEELNLIDLTNETLNQVKADLSGMIQTQVLEKVEKDLPKLTGGRYKDIRLDEEFHLEAFSEEKQDWVDPIENLSSGTVDQIYFVYRLALLKMIEGDKKAPLLLDDIFVTYDKLRSEEAKMLLAREGEGRQILLFTHDDDFSNWGNLVKVD